MARLLKKLPSRADLALGAVMVAVAVFAGLRGGAKGSGFESPDAWWKWALLMIPSALVVFRRSHSNQILIPATIAQIAIWGLGMPDTAASMAILVYSASAEGGDRGRRNAIGVAVAITLMTTLGAAVAPDVTLVMVPQVALVSAGAIFLGTNAAREKTSEAKFASEMAVAELKAEAARETELQAERERIARDLHDVLGHSLATIAVQATAAERVGDKNPQAAVDAVGVIAKAARSSLADIRQVLGGLRHGEPAEFAPAPNLASVRELVAEMEASGIEINFLEELDGREVGSAVATGVYRIVQESLTNVVKHAGPEAKVAIQLDSSADQLRIRVADDGRGPAAMNDGESGMGLVGMTERAEVLGGTLTAGRSPGGGFEVSATLPLAEPEPEQ